VCVFKESDLNLLPYYLLIKNISIKKKERKRFFFMNFDY